MTSRPYLPQIAIPLGIVAIVVVMVIPLPVILLDTLLAASITIGIVILLTAMLVKEPLEFSVFPAVLLVTTLFRLALNVSTTRQILSTGDGGRVIEAFGSFVVGGNLIIGLVIFLILIVINFAVVTNGAGRVAEVGARFTLDAMPGKQMAIDADLNAGLITDEQARSRRLHIAREADFYGSMDGASKFVKGDAIAGVIITLINLFGGMAIGVFQLGLSVGESVETFALLSVGDGLVSQIPALLISVAAGVIVTRASTDEVGGLGADVWGQLLSNRRVLLISAAATAFLGIMPGLPKLPFFLLAAVLGAAGYRLPAGATAAVAAEPDAPAPTPASDEDDLIADLRIEPLELELASDLFDLVDPAAGGTLLDRVRALRRQIAADLGFVVPLVRTRDNLTLPPSTYVIRLHGVETGRGEAPRGHVMVLATDIDPGRLPGRPTTDPVFGLPAVWVPEELGNHYEVQGATVVDRASVLVTHLSELIRRNAATLITRQDVQDLVKGLEQRAPAVAQEVGDAGISLAELQNVLRGLLTEGVPVRDLVRIVEAVTARARETRDPEALLEAARMALGAAICAQVQVDGRLPTITFDPLLEHQLLESRRVGEGGTFLDMDPRRTEQLLDALGRTVSRAQERGHRPIVVCSGQLRPVVRRLVTASPVPVPVLSYGELDPSFTIEPIEVITLEQADAAVQW
jgi:flagellar biosynthesis protein FlhA